MRRRGRFTKDSPSRVYKDSEGLQGTWEMKTFGRTRPHTRYIPSCPHAYRAIQKDLVPQLLGVQMCQCAFEGSDYSDSLVAQMGWNGRPYMVSYYLLPIHQLRVCIRGDKKKILTSIVNKLNPIVNNYLIQHCYICA